jgi:hypothetical protein
MCYRVLEARLSRFLLMVVVPVLLLSCGSLKESSQCNPSQWSHATGAPIVLSSQLPGTMGATLTHSVCGSVSLGQNQSAESASGINTGTLGGAEFFVPVMPVVTLDDTQYLSRPELLWVQSDGGVSVFYTFDDPPESFDPGLFQQVAVDGGMGMVPSTLLVSAAQAPDGNVFVSNSLTGEIFQLDGDAGRTPFATNVIGVSKVAFNHSGVLFAATAAIGYADGGMQPPQILSFDSNGTATDFFDFPANAFNYNAFSGFGHGPPDGGFSPFYPEGYLIDLAFDSQDNLFASLNWGNAIVRISDGGMQTLATPRVPSGIAVGPDDLVYFSTAPIFAETPNLVFMRGVQVNLIEADGSIVNLYTGPTMDPNTYNDGLFEGDSTDGGLDPDGGYVPVVSILSLNVDQSGNVYLEDSMAGTFLELPRQQ